LRALIVNSLDDSGIADIDLVLWVHLLANPGVLRSRTADTCYNRHIGPHNTGTQANLTVNVFLSAIAIIFS